MFQVNASDPNGDPLSFAATGLPAWLGIDTRTGMLAGTPEQGDIGTSADIVVSVSDGRASASLPPFRITIAAAAGGPSPPPSPPPPAAGAPTISGSPNASVLAGTAYSFTPSATGAQGRTLTFSISNRPTWAAFSSSTGRLSGTPTTSHVRTFSNIVITVSDGSQSTSLAPFSISVQAPPNTAPTISGTPPASVTSGTNYDFRPTASDANGDTLAFSITNKPAWATFSTATGRLNGTAQAGNYPNIVISVSDGTSTVSLPAFTLAVNQPADRSARLNWTAPTQNTDGSALNDLAGYRIYRGTSASALNEITQVAGAGNTSYSYNQLASGTHYFAVVAYNSAGVESALSAVGSKTIQ